MAQTQRGLTLIDGLIVLAIVSIVASLVIARLRRAQMSANETAVVRDIRTVIASQAAYHAASRGRYGVLTCLSTPSGAGCIPDHPVNGVTFLDPDIAGLEPRSGYVRVATYGATQGPSAGDREDYCYQARPASWNRTGVRSFGGDSSGVIGGTNADTDCCKAGILDTASCPSVE